MLFTSIYGLTFVGMTVAQTTISLYIPGADTQPVVGSIIASDATATTYALECAPGTDSDDCGLPGILTLTEGPSTAVWSNGQQTVNGTDTVVIFTGVVECSLDASSAVCAESFGGTEANYPGTTTETFTGTDFAYMQVIITDGPLDTGAAAAPSSTNAAPTASSTGDAVESNSAAESSSAVGSSSAVESSSATVPKSGSSSKSGATKTSAGTAQTQGSSSKATSSSSTGGVPMITGNAKWVLGGAALAAALI